MSSGFWSIVYAVGAGQGLLLALALWRKPGDGHAFKILSLWIALLSVHLVVLIAYLNSMPTAGVLLGLYGVTHFLPFTYAGFLFTFTRVLVATRAVRIADLVHLIPLAVVMLLHSDFLLLPAEELAPLLSKGILPERMASWRLLALNSSMVVLSIGYLGFSLKSVLVYRRLLVGQRADADRTGAPWLLHLVYWQIAIWVVVLLTTLTRAPMFSQWLIYGAVSLWLWTLGYKSLRANVPSVASSPARTLTSDDERYPEVLARIEGLMGDHELYRKPALTIGELAKRAGYPEYLVSEALNHGREESFYEFISRWRIGAVKLDLEKVDNASNILDIAYAAGFTSKSTFNTAFKRSEGMTPSAYRRDAQKGIRIQPN